MKRVVISGIGLISPLGNDKDIFWQNLTAGKCGIDYITKFDTTDFKVKVAAEVKNFNPPDYMEKNEARRMDLYCQYGVAAAQMAISDSKIVSGVNVDADRFGVYIGSGVGGMTTFMTEAEKLLAKGPSRVSPLFVPMMIANMASGHTAIKFNAQGPCLPVVTACATSTNTIGEAFRAIKFGYADCIVAGGCEAPIIPIAVAGFTNCMALSLKNNPNECCTPFDKRRDGFVMSEGGACVMLEEYEHALNRGAVIYAEITGYGNTCDAYHITAPHPEADGASKAITLAVKEGNIDIQSSSKLYINAHGTSTPLNDKLETLAIKKALGENAYKAYISSTKSMTGHMLGAAGAIEAIASILALKNKTIPPTIGYKEKDAECDLNYVPNQKIQTEINQALSISLGFGGHNACLAFKEIRG